MQHSIEWQNDATNAAPEEQATVGDLRLFLCGQNVTKHMFGDRLDDHVTVALYGLANGLIHDWWKILGSRDREFSLRDYRTGYLLPDVRIQFDGAVFEIAAYQCAYDNPDIRFWGGNREVLSRGEGEAWLSSFVGDVLERLRTKGLAGTSAALRWKRVQSSRNSQDRHFCEAAGGLGLDPYQITDAVADFIERAEAHFDTEALVEFVSGSGEVDRTKLMDWVDRMTSFKGSKYRLGNLRSVVDEVAREVPNRPGEQAWAAGYRRARAMRLALNMDEKTRLTSFRNLANRLGAASNYNLAPKVDGINALRREAENGIDIHVRNHGESESAKPRHLFAMARAVGDAACFPGQETAPINRLRNAYRQAAGRAFAAEFLAPINEIRSMREDAYDEYSIANEFGVDTSVIQHQLENEQRIERACV